MLAPVATGAAIARELLRDLRNLGIVFGLADDLAGAGGDLTPALRRRAKPDVSLRGAGGGGGGKRAGERQPREDEAHDDDQDGGRPGHCGKGRHGACARPINFEKAVLQ